MSPYNYFAGNPVKLVDVGGTSTDVVENEDGSFTVSSAFNDCNIYIVDANGKRTGGLFGKTLQPFEFLSAEKDGSFAYKRGKQMSHFHMTIYG